MKNYNFLASFFKSITLIFVILSSGCSKVLDLTKTPTEKNYGQFEQFVKTGAPSWEAFIALQRIAEPMIQQRKWEEAVETYRRYAHLFPTQAMQSRIDKIIKILEAEEEVLILTNLAFSINTTADEYSPVLSLDEKRIYFTGRNRVGGHGEEDIFYSDFIDGQWLSAVNIGRNINTKKGNESLDAISPDGNTLFLWGNYRGSFGNGDIFFSHKTSDGWGSKQHFPPPVNTGYFEGNAYMTADGQAILFSSDRPGGIGEYNPKGMLFNGGYVGNTDLYVIVKTETGWSNPINLGRTINTPYAEYSPFFHPDGKTLYFSSDGHPGLGRMDVFKSERLDKNSWTSWSEPVNLGKDINTAQHDWAYRISLSGEVAYFATKGLNQGFGGYDIYTITLPELVKPDPVFIVNGIVIDQHGNPVTEADIKWFEKETKFLIGSIKSDPVDGTFAIVLKPQCVYDYHVSKKQFIPLSNSLLTAELDESFVLTIELISIEEIVKEQKAIVLENIFFEFNKYDLLPESFPELDKLAGWLVENPEYNVEILGHTDNIGSYEYNLNLSENRAQSVVAYLVSVGCQPSTISAKGYGYSIPIDTNDTEEGRANNRRVEFRLQKN